MGLDFSKKVCYNNFRCGGVAQLVRAFGSHPRGRGFEPLRLHHIKSRITLSFVRCLRFSFCLVYARQYPYGVIYKICKSKCKPNINCYRGSSVLSTDINADRLCLFMGFEEVPGVGLYPILHIPLQPALRYIMLQSDDCLKAMSGKYCRHLFSGLLGYINYAANLSFTLSPAIH